MLNWGAGRTQWIDDLKGALLHKKHDVQVALDELSRQPASVDVPLLQKKMDVQSESGESSPQFASIDLSPTLLTSKHTRRHKHGVFDDASRTSHADEVSRDSQKKLRNLEAALVACIGELEGLGRLDDAFKEI